MCQTNLSFSCQRSEILIHRHRVIRYPHVPRFRLECTEIIEIHFYCLNPIAHFAHIPICLLVYSLPYLIYQPHSSILNPCEYGQGLEVCNIHLSHCCRFRLGSELWLREKLLQDRNYLCPGNLSEYLKNRNDNL